ncbi:MAG: hypothetical protein ACJ8FU_08440 [Xanthobacteraceae bacterium]
MNALASAWAEAQVVDDPAAHRVLLALAANERLSVPQIAILSDVTDDAVETHVAALVNAGLLLVRGDRLELNFDLDMLVRHLRRNRGQIGSGGSPAAVEPKPAPEPEPKPAKAPVALQSRVFVRQGSPEWDAWMRARGPRGAPVTYSGGAAGWWFPSQWPPSSQEQRGAA